MDAYVFKAGLWCESCASRIKDSVIFTPMQDDSENWPQGPFCDGGGEADSPRHCDACNVFLENPLTDDGRDYVQGALDNYRITPTVTAWADFYGINPTADDE